jgi:hypothetical protein
MQLLNVATASAQTGTSSKYNDVASLWRDAYNTIYIDGTFGGATVVVECSPDPLSLADASSRWHTITSATAAGMVLTNYKYKKIRARVSVAGTGTLVVEVL